jgi:polyribonucleotide nucleotidyltransferase
LTSTSLQALEFEKESNAELKFTIPRRAVARVLGRGGATVNVIKDQTGAQIDIDKDSGDNAVIIVHGSKQVIADAKAMILEIAEQVHEEKSDVVTVESKYHRTLIGAGGQGLRDLIARAGGPSDPKQQVGLVRL